MDIVTHAMMGTVLGSALMPHAPLTASCFILGNILPDVDVLSRMLGKRMFMRCHQTYTHALSAILLVSMIAWFVIPADFQEPYAGLGLAAGMLLHCFTDVSNTYGIALFLPFSRRRYSLEWVFFIDAPVLVVSTTCILLVADEFVRHRSFSCAVPLAYLAFLLSYWCLKAYLRARAQHRSPWPALALIPSALVPWQFFGCSRTEGGIRLFRLDLLNGKVSGEEVCAVVDDQFVHVLRGIPEYLLMRDLSPAYHAVAIKSENGRIELTCRDFRTRNFNTSFGSLQITVSKNGEPAEILFNV